MKLKLFKFKHIKKKKTVYILTKTKKKALEILKNNYNFEQFKLQTT